ncbi:MAG: hypothetical protein IPJ97_17710 [Proteobacteria bacterium]|nr:hypothetical protein [Pseudomonadota bacterium]
MSRHFVEFNADHTCREFFLKHLNEHPHDKGERHQHQHNDGRRRPQKSAAKR